MTGGLRRPVTVLLGLTLTVAGAAGCRTRAGAGTTPADSAPTTPAGDLARPGPTPTGTVATARPRPAPTGTGPAISQAELDEYTRMADHSEQVLRSAEAAVADDGQ